MPKRYWRYWGDADGVAAFCVKSNVWYVFKPSGCNLKKAKDTLDIVFEYFNQMPILYGSHGQIKLA